MASDKTSIANMALGHLAVTKQFTDFETDTSSRKLALDAFYDIAVARVFRDFDWPFATSIVALVPATNPNEEEWQFCYEYPGDPADVTRISRIVSGVWPEGPKDRVPYRIIGNATNDGRLILTTKENAKVEYTQVIDESEFWTSDFIEAFALLWAALAAPGVTGGDQFKLGIRALELYGAAINNAMLNAMNEDKPTQPAESEFITARN